ncbi:MAG: peptide ABC transporter substrate-binding protein [Oscillospiraceae bacterium]
MQKRLLALALALTMAIASLTGCGVPGQDSSAATPETDSGTKAPKTTFKYSVLGEAPTLDPQLSNSRPSNTIGVHIFECLTRTTAGKLEKGGSESWEISEDGLTYTFHLKDMLWSDGQPVKAQDYEYGIRRLMDPATASPYAFFGEIIKNGLAVEQGKMKPEELGVKAIDDKTVVIEIEYPATYFLSMLSAMSFAPVRQDYVEKYGKDFAATADKNVYNGPFAVDQILTGDRLILAKNDKYWNNEAIKLENVEIINVADGNTALSMYENGDLDFVDVPLEVIDLYKDKVKSYYDGSNDFLRLNMDGRCELTNKNLRLAINYAINRTEFITLTSNDAWSANTRYVLPQVQGVSKTYGEEYPYSAFPVDGDKVKAKEYLDAALKELGKTADQIELEMMTTDTERSKKQAEVLQQQIQDVLGIKITIKQVPYKQKLDLDDKHEFEISFGGWAPDYSDPYTYLELWPTGASYNQGSYSSEVYDNYIKQAKECVNDPKARMDALFNAEKTLCEDGAIVPLLLRQRQYMVDDSFKGTEMYFLGADINFVYAYFE